MLACTETQTKKSVTFAEAKRRLLDLKSPTSDHVERVLERTQALLQLLTTFEAVYPAEYRSKLTGVSLSPRNLPEEEGDFIDYFLHLIEQQFPLDFEATIENFYDGGCGDLFIHIQPCGMPVSDEEIEEAMNGYYDFSWSSLETCILFLNSDMTSTEHWNWARKYFGWKFPAPLSLTRRLEAIDWDLLFQKFDEEGLSCLKAAFNVVCRDVDNVFIDYNPYDQTQVDVSYELLFTEETVAMLAAKWAEASLVLEEHKKAIEMMDADPTLGKRIIKLWNSCCKFKKGE